MKSIPSSSYETVGGYRKYNAEQFSSCVIGQSVRESESTNDKAIDNDIY